MEAAPLVLLVELADNLVDGELLLEELLVGGLPGDLLLSELLLEVLLVLNAQLLPLLRLDLLGPLGALGLVLEELDQLGILELTHTHHQFIITSFIIVKSSV